MSFTSSLSVRTRTVLVYVVEIFFYLTSMENILQSIVKIIIIGCLYERTKVHCNRQFLPPPLPYYQNDDYFLPDFAPSYREMVPFYYREQNSPSPVSYQNMNSYTPPQLFYQNENYNPSPPANLGVKFSMPQIFPYKSNFYQSYQQPQKINFEVSQINYKKPLVVQEGSHDRPAEASLKKSAVFATNIIVREESQPPYYHDDYNKNYQDDDYSDNYSDEVPSQPEPCVLSSPYRYFVPSKPDPNNPNADNKYNLCNPYFQPNFGNSIYSVKMPITLLPSRFPPRVEQLIERIQNYFSTYTHQQTPKPENQTTSPAVPPVTEASSESETQPSAMADLIKKNITGENQELNPEQTNAEQFEITTAGELNNPEPVTQKIIVVEIEDTNEEEIPSTAAPDAQRPKESQMVVKTTQSPLIQTESDFITTDTFSNHQELQVNEETLKNNSKTQVLPEENGSLIVNSVIISKVENPEREKLLMEMRSTTESAKEKGETEESSTIQPINITLQNEVTDNKG